MRARGASSRCANRADTNSIKETENTGSVAKQQPPGYAARPHQQHSIAEACPVLYTVYSLHSSKIEGFVQERWREENYVDIDIRKIGEVQVFRLRGPLTLGDPVDNLRQALDEVINVGDTNLVLNLGDVRWIDSSGIGVVVKALTSAKRNGGTMKLVNPSKPALQTLKMCGLLPLFEIYNEESEAVQSFA